MRIVKLIKKDFRRISVNVTREHKINYSYYSGHPLIRPFVENPIVSMFYWDKVSRLLNLVRFRKDSTVLDAGCGPGMFLPSLSRNFKEVYAIDINSNDLKIAEALKKTKCMNNVKFVESNILDLPFKDKMFDTVFTVDVLEHIIKMDDAVDELSRVIKDGGYLAATIPTENKGHVFARSLFGYKKPKDHYYGSKETISFIRKKFKLVRKTTPLFIPEIITPIIVAVFRKR